MLTPADLEVPRLGECTFESPISDLLARRKPTSLDVTEFDRVVSVDTISAIEKAQSEGGIPCFEPAGARRKLFFDPTASKAGMVTCGGLCPGLNDVIRGLVMILWHRYGVREIYGFRNGYAGLNPAVGRKPLQLTPEVVSDIHEAGGTILGTSRGPQEPAVMLDTLEQLGINMLFAIGGDGTLRGAAAVSKEASRRGYPLSVIGIPKTIDNDILYVERSFGFETAFGKAVEAIRAAHVEAKGSPGGIGLVKVMGRASGFVAAYAALANNDANFVLIPEVRFPLEGPDGLLPLLEDRLRHRDHAVVVVGEGAGQHLLQSTGETDKSGNLKFADIGLFLKDTIGGYLRARGVEHSIKYIDPSYLIRGLKAGPDDSVYCFRLAAYAVHAAMAGRTEMLVGHYHGRFVHIPIAVAIRGRQFIDPDGDLWLSVLEATGQPRWYDETFADAPG